MKMRRKGYGGFMSYVNVVNALRTCRADVLLLAIGVTLLTALLKRTLLKNASKKLFVFLPFALGVLLVGVYRVIAAQGLSPLTEEFAQTLEGGFSCGCAANLYYCVYEQFVRGKKGVTPLASLLVGFVPEGMEEEAAREIEEKTASLEEQKIPAAVREILLSYAPGLAEEEAEACAALITAYLLQ